MANLLLLKRLEKKLREAIARGATVKDERKRAKG